jgi:hypothetical protein
MRCQRGDLELRHEHIHVDFDFYLELVEQLR